MIFLAGQVRRPLSSPTKDNNYGMLKRHRHHTHSTLLFLLIIICIIFDSHSLSFVAHSLRSTNRISLGCNRGVESSHHHPLEEETLSLNNAKRWNTNTNNSNNWEAHSLRRQYQQNGNNIIYKKSILSPNEVSAVNSALQSMNIQQYLTNENAKQSFATYRKGMSISRHNEAGGAMLYDIFGRVGGSMYTLVNAISGPITSDQSEYYSDNIHATNSDMILAPDIPIELRIYETYGAGMGWHIDDVLYKPLSQIEIIYTVDNTSDCCTMWRDNKNKDVTSIQTTPNSALVLQAGGVEHKVSPLSHGKRTILKMAYINKMGTTLDVNMAKHTSHYNKPNKDRRV